MIGRRPIALLGVALGLALGAGSAPASATTRQQDGGDAILDGVGTGWQATGCPPSVANVPQKCFANPQTGAEINIFAMNVPSGIRANDFVQVLAGSQGGTPRAVSGLPTARGFEVDIGTPGSRTFLILVPGREHVFSIWFTSPTGVGPDPGPFLAELGRRQAAREGPSPAPARRAPTDRELERMLVSAPAATGLQEIPLSAVASGLGRLRKVARNERVVELLEKDQKTSVRAFASPTVFVYVELDRLPFDEFAATELGVVTRQSDRSRLPGLGRVTDAVALRPAPDQVIVFFRRGPHLVTIGTNSDAAAVYFARKQAARLPQGATGPYYFPSTTRAVTIVVALTTGVCLAFVGVSRVRARRFRHRSGPRAEPSSSPMAPAAAVDDVTGDARHLRSMGAALAAAQIVAVNLVVLGVCALLDVFKGMSTWVALALLAAGLAGGMWFTQWQRRRELEAIGPQTNGWRPSVPAPAGAVVGAIAVILLIGGIAMLAYGAADLAFGSSLRTLERAASLAIDPGQLSIAILLLGLVLVAIGGLAFRLARMLARAHADALRQRDQRPAILYLRSFEDDQLSVATVLSARRPFFELFRVRGIDPFEEAITWELAPYGPVIAVGRPGRSLASLGAAREHLPDDQWRERVAEFMHDSRAVVMTIGATDGLQWEIERVAAARDVAKTIFVFPPLDGAKLAERWEFTADALRAAGVDAPPLPSDIARVLTAVLASGGSWHVTASDTRDEATYRAAIDRSIPWLSEQLEVPIGETENV